MNIKYIRLLTLTLFSLIYSFVFAGRIDQTSSIHTPLGGSPVVVGTATAMDSVSVSSPSALEVDHHLFNRISFGVDLDYEEFVSTEQKVKVSIHLERFNANNVALPSLDFYLDISYRHSDTLHSHILSSYDFSGVYKFIYRIDSIWVDDVLTNTLPKNLFVQGDLFLERYTTLNTTTQVSSNLSFMDTDHDGINDGIEFRWSNIAGAEAYEIEFMHVSNFGSSGSIISPSSLSYDFRNNSTRITTSELSYRIALVFDRGWVAYRVRPVGVDVNNPDHLIYGSWNALRSGKISNISSNNKIEITADDVHESTLNWQYSATYGENGKRKEVISYADGSLRSRQAVTKINSNDNVVVGETIYDYLGRPVVNVLPTPVERNSNDTLTLKYYPFFNLNSQGLPYSKKDFTDTTDACGVSAEPMSTNNGASRYYSSDNPNQDLHQGYVPDAGGYPFTQVEYTPDKTGRINRQGGVGADFQIGSGKESRYLYGNPTQLELDRMFGSEVGYSEHYQKNVVIDGNGQASVSYVDLSGRVIATALAGSSPNNLTSINNAEEQALEINQILPDGSNQEVDLLNNSITFSSSFILSSPSDVAISYEFLTTPMIDTCVTDVCFDCVYDLEFTLRDECGNNLLPDSLQHKVIGNFVLNGEGETVFHSDCVDTSSFNAYVELTSLPIGKYTISKKLTIHEPAIESYLSYVGSSVCAKTYEDFLSEEMDAIDTLACEISCDNCLDNLGSLSDYVGNGYGTSADYYLEVEECQKLCEEKVSDCEIYFTMLTTDMAPGGQYAEYLTPSGEEVWNFPLSILNASNQLLTSGASWRNPQLITPNGAISHYVNEQGERSRIYLTEDADSAGLFLPRPVSTGVIEYDAAQDAYFIYPENLKYVSDFVYYFEFSWSKSLVSYHPEYCYYESCIKHEEKYTETDDFSSASFDELLQNTTSFQQAQTLGLIDGNGLPTNWLTISSSQPWDPFIARASSFEGSSCTGFAQDLVNNFSNFRSILGAWYSMAEIAAYTIRCGGDFSQQPDPSCFSFGQPFSGTQSVDTVILNKEWNVLKTLYLSTKQEFKQELAGCIALKECKRFNGCIGNDEFNPYPELIGLHLTSPQDLFNQPFFNENHLCSYFNYELYRDKIKRFPNAEDVIQDHDANSTSYEVYLQTGQCPNAFILQHLLNELVEKEKLLENGFNLNTLDYLSALFQSDNNYNNPGPIPSLTYEVSSTSTNLTAEWKDASNNLYATLTLTKGSLVDWSEIMGVINLQATGTHSFTTEGKYVENDTVKYISLSGSLIPEISTQFKLDDCSFAHECSSSQLAIDLTGLFNILNLNNDLFSTTPISISPYVPLGSDLATLYIENAAGMGSNLSFVFNQSENYIRIYDASMAGNHGLYIQFLDVVGTIVNLNDITGLELMTSTGNSSFEIVAHQLNGGDLIYSGILYQVYGDGEKVGLPAGKCGLPTPMACQGRAFEAFEDIQLLLEDALSQFDGTSAIDLYSSTYITPSIVSSFPYGVDFTTNIDYGDSLVISAGGCDIVLSLQDNVYSLSFQDLVSISSFELTGEINFDFGYNDFYFVGFFNTPSGIVADTVFGTSCITLKDCFPCGEENSTPSAMQMDSWGVFSLLALDSSVVTNVGGTSPLFLPMGCEEYWDALNDCVYYFIKNYQGDLDNMVIEYLTRIDLDCECGADFYCDLLYNILGEEIVFSSTKELLNFIDYERNCKGCEKEYELYLSSVMKFNSADYPYSITPISEALFVAYGFCDCVEEYETLLFDILVNKLKFSSQEEFDNYVSLNRVCQGTEVDCGANKETYYVCVKNFIKHYEGTPFYELIITYFENTDIDCSCNSKNYCGLLDYIIDNHIEFQTIDEFLNFTAYQSSYIGCEKEYELYLSSVMKFNSADYPYSITPISEALFVAYGFCDCVEEYETLIFDILVDKLTFSSQEEFDNYVSLHRVCHGTEVDCGANKETYYVCVENFIKHYEGTPFYELIITYFENTDIDCSCNSKNYCGLLDYIIDNHIEFQTIDEFLNFTAYQSSYIGCEKEYELYLSSVMKFNSADYPYSITPISEALFVAYGFCDCVEEYETLIFDILVDKLTFSSQEEFDNYVSLHRVCQGTEVDCGANKDTYYVCVENFIKHYEGTPSYELIIKYFENTDIDCSCNSKNYCGLLDYIIDNHIEFQTIDEFLNFIDYERNCKGCEKEYELYLSSVMKFNSADYPYSITPISEALFVAYGFCDCVEEYETLIFDILVDKLTFSSQEEFDNYVSLHRVCHGTEVDCGANKETYYVCVENFIKHYEGTPFYELIITYFENTDIDCSCNSKNYCGLLDYIIDNHIEFQTIDEFLNFTAYQSSYIGCEKEYELYLSSVMKFNSADYPYSITPISEALFVAYGFCDCVEEYETLIFDILVDKLTFSSQEEFDNYVSLHRVCQGTEVDCGANKDTYYVCVENFIKHYEGTPSYELIIKYFENTDIDCSCNSKNYCGLLDYIIDNHIEFQTIDEFLNFIDYERNCKGCEKEYELYLSSVMKFNSADYPYSITPISEALFVAYGFCDCVEEYETLIFDILVDKLTFSSQEEFDNYVSLHRVCHGTEVDCGANKETYYVCVENFIKHYEGTPFYELIITYFENTDIDCSCNSKNYCGLLDYIIDNHIEFQTIDEFLNFTAYQSSYIGCEKEYELYLSSVMKFNSADYPYSITPISEALFVAYGFCDCVEEYETLIFDILVDKLTFSSQEEFDNYVSLNRVCHGTEVDCGANKETYDVCVENFIKHYEGTPSYELIIKYFENTDIDCSCNSKNYCGLLDYIIDNHIEFQTIDEFLNFIDYERNCKGCEKEYELYLSSVMKFNSADYPYSITPISEALFVAYGFCDCVEEYETLIFDILVDKLTFS